MQIPVTAVLASLMAILLTFLGLRVSQLRLEHRVAIGDGGIKPLGNAIRVHANTAEWAPCFVVLSACYEIYAGASLWLIGVVSAFVLARLVFAVGMTRNTLSAGRRYGMLVTYLCYLLLATSLLWQVLAAFS